MGGPVRRLYHLAVPPAAFTSVVSVLGATGLATGARVIVEKPFGTDLASARALNEAVHEVFDESQVFRIDHFLGKESVDNILAFRFANGLFEPVWNRQHIRYVEIDVPETLTIKGRGAFYDATGAYRDMIVTHLFQVLAFVAMESPVSLSAKHLRDEKEKVFEAVKPIDVRHGRQNEIVIDFADPGAIKLYFLTKVPGAQLSLGNAEMAFYYKDSFAASHMLEGYEHLILMAMVGDQSLFTRSDGIERLWEISEPLLENPPPAEPYAVGSYGPESMKRLIALYHWHLPHV